ncbi:hypothetical protein TNCV_221171 [Trichonephila clavipes]|nr:hypothetical protein TNCV_221171 [Trichonephila clavipes]
MSAETTDIPDERYSDVASSASYISDFWFRQKKKFKGLRSGENGGQEISPQRSIHLSGYKARKWFKISFEKCARAPSYTSYTFWCAVMSSPCRNCGKTCYSKT